MDEADRMVGCRPGERPSPPRPDVVRARAFLDEERVFHVCADPRYQLALLDEDVERDAGAQPAGLHIGAWPAGRVADGLVADVDRATGEISADRTGRIRQEPGDSGL